jgi:hypothetical protein
MFRQKRNLFLQVTARSVRIFLEVPAKKECSSFFLGPRFLRIPGNSGDSCNNAQPDNECETLKATHARNQKTRSDIVTMNAALLDVFLANLPQAIRKTYEPICMKEPNTVFLHMFDWFIAKYGKTMTKDRKENWQ